MKKKIAYSSSLLAFTLIELVVSATILVILTSIGFYSYTKNIGDARDSTRKTDISALSSQLKLYKKQRWAFPRPGKSFEIHNRGGVVAYQWFMDKSVTLSTAEKLPLDPELGIPYFYSTTKNRQEYQLALSLENSDDPYTFLSWNYKSVAKSILPSILLATGSTLPIEIHDGIWAWSENRKLFLLNTGFHNIPYDFESGLPQSDGTSFSGILDDVSNDYWQNTDYRNCWEISAAAKRITPDGQTDQYQILNTSGILVYQNCSCSATGCYE